MEEILLPNKGGFRQIQTYPKNPIPIYVKVSLYFLLKRLRLGKTTGWQHRFFDLTILSPIWLGTYECMKSSLDNFFLV